MASKLITKIKNRPSYYYFDTAIKGDKKVTVKYCLFTNDFYEAKALAIRIKHKANLKTTHESFGQNTNNILRYQIKQSLQTKKLSKHITVTEYRELFETVMREIYSIGTDDKQICIQSEKIENHCHRASKNDNILEESSWLNFKQIANRYIASECQKLNSKNGGYYKRVANVLDIFFAKKQIKDISYQDCENFQYYLLNDKKLNKKTINNYTCYATRMFDYAIKIGLIVTNPFRLLSTYRITRAEKSSKDNFTNSQLEQIFNTDRQDLKNYMAFALHTGLRLSEIWSLDKNSIGETNGIIYIKVQTAKQKRRDG